MDDRNVELAERSPGEMNEIVERDGEHQMAVEYEESSEIVVGLDIGTAKICCVAAEISADRVEVLGIGIAPSRGVKKGNIVNIETAVVSVRQAVERAEQMSGHDLRGAEVYVGISGNHIKGFNSPGIVNMNGREITEAHVREVIEAAQAVKIPDNQEILHVLPIEYMVDDQTGLQSPVGMSGIRLVANVHIVTADSMRIHNLTVCCQQAGLRVAAIVLESIASSRAVLSSEEMEYGVALLDIGAGTTDLAIFNDGSIRHTREVPLGGHNLTNDLSVGLRTPMQDAERLKENYGAAISSGIKKNLYVEVPSVGNQQPRQITQTVLVEILEARILELLEIANKDEFFNKQKAKLAGGMVLTGGTALLPQLESLAGDIFDLQVRVGYPVGVTGRVETLNNPRCAAAVGLVIYAKEEKRKLAESPPSKWEGFLNFLRRFM